MVSMDASAPTKKDKKDKKSKKRKSLADISDAADGAPAANGTPAAAAPEALPTAGSSFKKKLKKQRKLEAAAAVAAAGGVAANGAVPENGTAAAASQDAASSPPDGLDKAARKALKKQKKAEAAAAASAAADDSSAPSAKSAAAADEHLSKKERKARKAAAAAAQSTNGDVPAASAAEQSDKPKKKKRKAAAAPASHNPAAAGPRRMAEVGDAALAASSKPIVRSTYVEHPETAAQTAAELTTFREERSTVVDACDLKPVRAFEHSSFGPELLQSCASFTSPSPIQTECWAPACAGRDVIGIAATGSGKTLAFGLPALAHTQAQLAAGVADGRTPSVLILAPTRELAMQIAGVLESAGAPVGLKTLCVYGGVPKHPQAKTLRGGVNVLVATPGRLEDLLNDGAARLHQATFLVLDEADRMLDLGFEPHIRAIAGQTRADRQTLMFSATWPPAIQKLASEFLSDPVKVTIGSADLSASHSVSQVIEVIDPRQRDRRLQELLKQYHGAKRQNRVIVFVLYKKEAARVEQALNRSGWKAVAVHGDASQAARTAAVDSFKRGETPLLIATDVAARGLDIDNVEVVINYSFPLTTEDYVHRIGRTGRAGKTGAAHTFFSGETDKARAGELINVLREAGQPVPPELLKFGTTVKKKESKLYGAHFKEVDFSKKATKVTFDDSD